MRPDVSIQAGPLSAFGKGPARSETSGLPFCLDKTSKGKTDWELSNNLNNCQRPLDWTRT